MKRPLGMHIVYTLTLPLQLSLEWKTWAQEGRFSRVPTGLVSAPLTIAPWLAAGFASIGFISWTTALCFLCAYFAWPAFLYGFMMFFENVVFDRKWLDTRLWVEGH